MIRNLPLSLLLTAVLAAAVMAAEPPPSVQMKLNYAKSVVMTSSNAQRVEASDNEMAKERLAAAREKYAAAEAAAEAGDFQAADALSSEAMLLVIAAARMVPDVASVEQQARERNAELLQQIDTYTNWYWEFHDRAAPHDAEIDQLALDVEEAKKVAEAGNYPEANTRLEKLLKVLIAKTDESLLERRTVTYDLKFDSVAEEYDYELSRNREFERLVAIAIEQKQPSAGMRGLIDRFVNKALDMRAQAEKHRQADEFEPAIQLLHEATGQLETALKMAGVR